MDLQGIPDQIQSLASKKELQRCQRLYSEKHDKVKQGYLQMMYSNSQMVHQLRLLLNFCQRLKQSIKTQIQNKQLAENQVRKVPEFVMKEVKNVRRVNEQNIVCVANKMKVFVSKTMQMQSSKLRYNYTSYMNMLWDELSAFRFSHPVEKTRQQFDKIRKNFNLISVYAARLYKHHPSEFLLSPLLVNGFVSFYMERLLFFQQQPLPFNGNILFAPIIFVKIKNKQTDKINFVHIQFRYITQLYRQNDNWQTYCLELIFKDRITNQIKNYFCASFKKGNNEISEICSCLRKIRTFVYFSMIFNYLKHTIVQNDTVTSFKRSIVINLKNNMVFEINTERQIKNDKLQQNPKLIQQFLRYFDESNMRKRAEVNKAQVLSNLVSYLQNILCKIKIDSNVAEEYLYIKPKYMYSGNRRVQV